MLLFTEPHIPLGDEEFLQLRDLIHSHCGLYFDNDNRYLLEKRLAGRLQALNLPTFRDYFYYLRYDRGHEQEMSNIMDILTTNETYFFREAFQLKAFTEEIVPELVAAKARQGDRTLRIWSAGCSSGEEPYTIAMLLLETPALRGWRVEIVGTDISQRVLQLARKGLYRASSFRATDDRSINRFFTRQEDGHQISDEVRGLVSFSQLNLFDQTRLALLGKMDVIFCRNVIIYFDLAAKKRVIESFSRILVPGGFLLLGHSESLMNITTQFTLRHFVNDMVYQRPLEERGGLT